MIAARSRPQVFQDLETQHFDIAIIGGGITGAGVLCWSESERCSQLQAFGNELN